MTDAQKAEIYDRLLVKRVIVIRKGKRHIDGKDTQSTWIAQGENSEMLLDDIAAASGTEGTKE